MYFFFVLIENRLCSNDLKLQPGCSRHVKKCFNVNVHFASKRIQVEIHEDILNKIKTLQHNKLDYNC